MNQRSIFPYWPSLQQINGAITGTIDRYVVDQMRQVQKSIPEPSCSQSTSDTNPHVSRIEAEHCYETPHHVHMSQIQSEHDYLPSKPQGKKRKLPPWMDPVTTLRSPTLAVRRTALDGVLEYSCAVLNDGLFSLDLRW